MDSIKLSTKKADELCSFFRECLENEDKAYQKFQKEASEFVKSEVDIENPLQKFVIQTGLEVAEQKHKVTVEKFSRYLEYLTIGDE